MIALGLSEAEVAGRLGAAVHAVKFHLGRVYRKLGVSNRTETAVAFQRGALDPGDGDSNGRDGPGEPTSDERLMQLRERVQASPPSLALPADRLRAGRGSALSTVTAFFGDEARRALERLVTESASSIEAVGMAAFAALAHHHVGEQALTFAVLDTESMFVVPIDVSPEMGFDEHLDHVSIAVADSRRHAPLSPDELRPTLDPEAKRDPVLPLLFLPELRDASNVSFDLALALESRPEGICASMLFPTALFDRSTVVRMLGHLEVLLAAAADDPSRAVARLPLLTDSERRRLLVDSNATAAPFPARCLHELLEERNKVHGNRVAAIGDDAELTYASLEAHANQLARHLRDLGIRREDPVGICVERSPSMLVGLLGILKAGGAYVPIDPSYPEERQAFMLEDAQAQVVVTEERLLSALPATDAQVVCLDRDRPVIDAASAEPPRVESDPEQLAYLIYTSGSTGKPKGVEIPHRALVNFLITMLDRPGLAPNDVLLAVTTLSFDIAGLELYLPLLAGGTMVIASQQQTSDPQSLVQLMDRHGVTVMQATPTTWRMLIDAGWPGRPGLKVLCGGEALPALLAEQLLARGVELWNMYGPTETTIWSTIHRLVPEEPLTIGRPIANTSLYILDGELEPTPVGIPGELHIGGAGLARGYRGRGDLTAERFIPHPFDATPDARIYKTGDLATYRADGTVEFLGRLDNQVKVRGFRIELGEIEAALGRHPSVRNAVATVREEIPGQPELVGYVITDGSAPSSTELRCFVGGSLPPYMVPSAVMTLDALPLTPNGKIDRKALPALPREREVKADFVAPRTPLEQRLVAIWEQMLDIRPIGVTDDFFELGATSIVAAQLFARIENELGHTLPLAPVFQAPTIEALVALLEQDDADSRWTSLVPIQPLGTKPPIFCVHGGAGTILHLEPLARRLGTDQPFYGLQAQGLYGRHPPHTSVEDMAAHYLDELRTVQPVGPYYLAGYCFGAIVAFEMAQRLRRDGEQVPLLVMFNGPSPSYIEAKELRDYPPVARPTNAARVKRALREPKRFWTWTVWHAEKAKRKLRQARFDFAVSHGRPLPEALRDASFIRICFFAERAYNPEAYDGTVAMFYGSGLYEDPALGWGDVIAGQIHSFEVPGAQTDNREAMHEPHVAFIAEHLERHLGAARHAVTLAAARSRRSAKASA